MGAITQNAEAVVKPDAVLSDLKSARFDTLHNDSAAVRDAQLL
jgi:hypothetical protein